MSGRETAGATSQACDNCRTWLDDEVKFCPECGQGVGQEVEAPVEWPPRMPERPRPRIFGAVLGALIVWTILVMILAFFVYAGMSTPAGV
jgi:hypothetical protein